MYFKTLVDAKRFAGIYREVFQIFILEVLTCKNVALMTIYSAIIMSITNF